MARNKLKKGLDWIAGSEPIIWFFVAPWLIFQISRTLTILSLAVIPILWLVRVLAGRPVTVKTPLNWPLLLLIFALGPAVIFSPQPYLSIEQATIFLCGVGLYFAFSNCNNYYRKPDRVVLIFVGFGLIVSLIALVGTEWEMEKMPFLAQIAHSMPRMRVGETGFSPDMIAGMMLILIPVVIASIVINSRQGRQPLMGNMKIRSWAASGVAGLMIFVLFLSQSRTAILIVFVTVGIFLASRWRIINLFVIALAITSFILLFLGVLSNHLTDWLIQIDKLGWFGAGLVDSWLQRQEIWSNALKTMRDYPLTGTGLGAFSSVVWHNYPFSNVPVPAGVKNANNLWLQSGVDFGLFGLFGFSWLAAVLFFIGWVVRRRQRDDDRVLLTGVWLGILAWLGFGLLNSVSLSTRPAIFVWILMGVIVGNWRRDDLVIMAADKRKIWINDAIGVLVVIVLVIAARQFPLWQLNRGANLLDRAILNNEPVLSKSLKHLEQAGELTGALNRRAFAHYLLGNQEQAVTLFRQNNEADDFLVSISKGYLCIDMVKGLEIAHFGLVTFPDSGRLACILGEAYNLKNETMTAFSYYRRVPSLSRDFEKSEIRQAECLYRLGEMQGELGWWGEAVRSFSSAAVLDPENVNHRIRQGWALYQATGELSQAIAIEEAALENHPNDIEILQVIANLYLDSGRFQKGLEWSDQVIEADPTNPEAWLRKARIHWALEEQDKATRALNEALRLDPMYAPALAFQSEWAVQ